MNKYLSFFRKKGHVGQDNTTGPLSVDKKEKNSRPVKHNENNMEEATSMVINSHSCSLVDNTSFAESDDGRSSLLKGELRLNSRQKNSEPEEDLDEPNFDSAIDDVIERAFSDLEIGLLTDTLTKIHENIGSLLEVNERKAGVSQSSEEESVVIVTETTEEEIVEVDTPPILEADNKQSLAMKYSPGIVSKKDVLRNEFTIKLIVPSENKSGLNVMDANSSNDDENPFIKIIKHDGNRRIKTSKSFDAFPSEKCYFKQLRHSKSCQSIASISVVDDESTKKLKRISVTGTSSEEEFDSAKENLSDDDFINVTRIYIQPNNEISNKLTLDQIDSAFPADISCHDTYSKLDIDPLAIIVDNDPLESPSVISSVVNQTEKSLHMSLDKLPVHKPDESLHTETTVSAFPEKSYSLMHMEAQAPDNVKIDEGTNTTQSMDNCVMLNSQEWKAKDLQEISSLLQIAESFTLKTPETTNYDILPEKSGDFSDDVKSDDLHSKVTSIRPTNEDLVKLVKENDETAGSSENSYKESKTKTNKWYVQKSGEIVGKNSVDASSRRTVDKDSHSDQENIPLENKFLDKGKEIVLDNLATEISVKKTLKACENPTNSKSIVANQEILQNVLVTSVCMDHDEAETRLAQRRAARVEAREMRLKELEKNQPEEDDDNDEEKQYVDNDVSAIDKRVKKNSQRLQSSANSKTSRPTRTSVGRSSLVSNSLSQISRRSSEDSIPDEVLPAFAKELKSELKEMEEKFRKAMITNAQLDNEKATLTYEVEFLKDKFTELEESHIQLTKEHRRKSSENEQLRKLSNKLKEEMKMLRKILQEREELIQEYGLVVVGEEENGEGSESEEDELMDDTINTLSPRKIAIKKALLSQEAAELLSKGAANGSLDVRLKRHAEEKNELEDEVRRLKMKLEEEVHRRMKENGLDSEKQKETSTYINDYKLRIQKSEAEVATLQANVARLESLVTRYKAQSEELEKSEEELKIERRKIMREFREAQIRLEETETLNSYLQKRFDKLKTARSTLLKDLSLDPT